MNNLEAKEIVSEAVKLAIGICGSQSQLAERTGITQGAVGKYLNKKALPTGVTAKKLSKAVNYSLSKERFAPHIFDEAA